MKAFQTLFIVSAVAAMTLGAHSASAFNYSIDDGTANFNTGIGGGGDIILLNSFTVDGNNNIIISIDIAFGLPADGLNGLPFTALLYADPNNDGNPNDAVLLAQAPGVISGAGTNTFVIVPIAPTLVLTNDFFVGYKLTHPDHTSPAALDTTDPDFANRSFIAGGSAGTGNIILLTANSLAVTAEENATGISGNWLIRADAIPEPSTGALTAIGLVVFLAAHCARAKKLRNAD